MKPKTSQAAILWVVLGLGVFFTLAMSPTVKAQNLIWAKKMGGAIAVFGGGDIAADSSGNSYATGIFSDSVTFGAGEPNETTLVSTGLDMFVAKYDSSGALLWAKGSSADTNEDPDFLTNGSWGYRVAVGGSGSSYVTGCFGGSVTFGAGEPNETMLVTTGGFELFGDCVGGVFVAKYDSTGALLWAKEVATATRDSLFLWVSGLAVDGVGNSYVVGQFQDSVTFVPGDLNETTLTTSGQDCFLAKFDTDGALVWAKRVSEAGDDTDLAVDSSGNSYLTSGFYGSTTFGLGDPMETTLTAAGGEFDSDIYVAKYNSTGALVWVKQAGGTAHDTGWSIGVDGAGNSYVTGRFGEDFENGGGGSATFGAGEPNETTLVSASDFGDFFVAKYDSSGALAWAKQLTVNGTTFYLPHIAVHSSGNSYVTGPFGDEDAGGSVTFGPGEVSETTLTSAGSLDIFVAKYASNGLLQWVRRAGGAGFDLSSRIAVDGSNNVHITGAFEGSAVFGPGEPNETTLISTDFENFIAKFAGGGVAPPDTIISSGPAAGTGGATNSSSAQFTFTSEPAGGTFTCSLDGSPFAACTSPKDYTSLAAGSHNFQVRATDAFGNTDPTPANYDWTVDTLAPNTVITFSPAALTNSTSATFQFTSTEAGTFECNLDGGGFTACTTPKTYNGLAEGAHTFQVRAIDAVNNTDPTPASFNWTISAAPDTLINSGPAADGGVTNSTTAIFSFTSTDPSATFACSLDNGVFSACTSPKTYTKLKAGNRIFRVQATTGGATDPTPAIFNWTIDTTAPNTTITSGPPALTNNPQATFTFTSTQAGGGYLCSLDGGPFAPCASPFTTDPLADGKHNFQVKAYDAAGNMDKSAAKAKAWTVDTISPDTTITKAPTNPTTSTSVAFKFASTEKKSTFQCNVDGAGFAICKSGQKYTGLLPGPHNFQVQATDAAGNIDPTPAIFNWTIQ